MKYVQPEQGAWEMTCPFCSTLVSQHWRKVYVQTSGDTPELREDALWVTCAACKKGSWWVGGSLVAPRVGISPPPQDGMPEDVLSLYDEARSVVDLSPRSASALLRTGLEVLLHNHLDQAGVALNEAIGNLVRAGKLDQELQQAMDFLRLTGNGAVHPKELQLDDRANNAEALFELLNLAVERLVTRPVKIRKLYEQLPESKRQAADKRDGRRPGATSPELGK